LTREVPFVPKLAEFIKLLTVNNGSVASFIKSDDQEEYYISLIWSQEKELHFQDKSQE